MDNLISQMETCNIENERHHYFLPNLEDIDCWSVLKMSIMSLVNYNGYISLLIEYSGHDIQFSNISYVADESSIIIFMIPIDRLIHLKQALENENIEDIYRLTSHIELLKDIYEIQDIPYLYNFKLKECMVNITIINAIKLHK